MRTSWKIRKVCESLEGFLLEKNKRYGDSALDPKKYFSKNNAEAAIMIRIDDKINRIKNSDKLRKNDILDLTGYLILLMVSKEWLSFKDLID